MSESAELFRPPIPTLEKWQAWWSETRAQQLASKAERARRLKQFTGIHKSALAVSAQHELSDMISNHPPIKAPHDQTDYEHNFHDLSA